MSEDNFPKNVEDTSLPNQNGGKRQGAGRPKGGLNRARFMQAKLEALELTPLVELLKLVNEHDRRISDNDKQNAPSAVFTGECLRHRGNLLRMLVPYQYSPLREDAVKETTERKPISIKLDLTGDPDEIDED